MSPRRTQTSERRLFRSQQMEFFFTEEHLKGCVSFTRLSETLSVERRIRFGSTTTGVLEKTVQQKMD